MAIRQRTRQFWSFVRLRQRGSPHARRALRNDLERVDAGRAAGAGTVQIVPLRHRLGGDHGRLQSRASGSQRRLPTSGARPSSKHAAPHARWLPCTRRGDAESVLGVARISDAEAPFRVGIPLSSAQGSQMRLTGSRRGSKMPATEPD
jgi:hypothetical protein